ESQLHELYKSEYTKGPANRRTFARQLLEEAQNSNSDPASRFVFYREARDVAAGAGDLPTALRAIDELSRLFAIDVTEYKTAAIMQAAKAVDDLPKSIALLREANSLINDLLAAENFPVINKLSPPLTNLAAQTRNRHIIVGFRNRLAQLREAQIEFEKLSAAVAHPP